MQRVNKDVRSGLHPRLANVGYANATNSTLQNIVVILSKQT